MDLIQRAIDKNGAKMVYRAAVDAMQGDTKPLADAGLIADSLGVVWAIMSQSHEQMTKEEQANEHWRVQKLLQQIPRDGQ